MDLRLLCWARAVKARRGRQFPLDPPPLWLFTDSVRRPDPLPSIARLPRGLCGVVFRHDDAPDRAALARRVATLCRERRLALVIAGDTQLEGRFGAGLHLRGGRRAGRPRGARFITSSAHDGVELRRAARAGAVVCFLSPAFPTASHPGAPSLGAARWSRLAGQASRPAFAVLALGGIDGDSVRRLPWRRCAGAGAITALA